MKFLSEFVEVRVISRPLWQPGLDTIGDFYLRGYDVKDKVLSLKFYCGTKGTETINGITPAVRQKVLGNTQKRITRSI